MSRSVPVRRRSGLAGLVLAVVLAALPASAPALAGPVQIFRSDSLADFTAGTREGVSVDTLGTLQLARRVEPVATLAEPFVFAAAAQGDGWILGTGSSGRVLRVAADGTVEELFAAPEPEVFAVLADDDGAVLAATSPDGKVYRIAGGAASELFDPPDQYIWALARDRRGDLLVATGLDGHLYRVRRDGSSEVVLATADRHLRSLAVLADGTVLAGTAGEGKILRIAPDGAVSTAHDATLPEVLALAPRPDGGAYAVVLASEASLVDLSPRPAAPIQAEGVTVVIQEPGTAGSRPNGAAGPRSLVLELAPDGAVSALAELDDRTVHSLLLHDGEVWLGTGEEGELYRISERRLVLEKDLEERQIPALVAGRRGVAVVTTNGAALYRLAGGVEEVGVFTSPVLDATQPSRFGALRWEGEAPRGTTVALQARSGMSSDPDGTWTAWTAAAEGRETSLAGLSPGRYVQWRATLGGDGGASPRIADVELSYRQENQPPEITKLEVLEPGQILVPQSFNPANQAYEPWSPNREGIFTGLRPAPPDDASSLRPLWKKGYRTVRWEAADPNGDTLEYGLDFRAEGDDGPWLPVGAALTESHYSFDATVLPDGRYRFRLTASDRRARPAAETLTAEDTSEPVVVDHSQPRLVSARRSGDTIRVELEDGASPLREVSVSTDAAAWTEAEPTDGLLDGRRETLEVAVPEGARLLLLRVTDAAFNVVTFDLLAAAR